MSLLSQLRATPNLLTLLRLFLVPFLVIALLDHHSGLALGLFMLGGASDALDGRLARQLGQSTKLGQFLDPIVDKLMLSTLFVTLTHLGLVPYYVTVLVFARDLGILVISTLLFFTHTYRDFQPSWIGKLNTLVQIMTVFLLLVAQTVGSPRLDHVVSALLIGIAWLAPISAAQYAFVTMQRVSEVTPEGI